ncbi:hypothetical protein [Neobacillus cucumis]|uniref:hypothetical protein n=1 Tax=Neobacillus cucumis TaxID=1740721 RepID=UPI0019655F19|nr:hypothetical protein [Neobacillus cucumis]MBM7656074.1 hypothetical protein [Neobacillus cucumis]
MNEIGGACEVAFIAEKINQPYYDQELSSLQKKMEQLFKKYPDLKEKQQSVLQRHALYAQHEAVEKLIKEDVISYEVAEREHNQITDRLVRLDE